jgi:hypothetical protein
MLIEQAFYNLPEILVGSGYARQEYEAGIVSAFSLALLQELNGRNAPNPISFITAEKRFSNNIKKLRADLHVRLGNLYVGSKKYSDFGFRYSNWIEAKFFRSGKGVAPSTQNLGQVVADLVRLAALVPIERAKDKNGNNTDLAITGRYFLHVYYGDPLVHVSPVRKKKGAQSRKWVETLFKEGSVDIDDFELGQETNTFFTHLGKGLSTLKCSMKLTNIKIAPHSASKQPFYTFVLSRIDEATTQFNGRSFSFKSERTFSCVPPDCFEDFRKDIASQIKPKKVAQATDSSEDAATDNDEVSDDE